MGAQGLGNVAHAIAKMNTRSRDSNQIMDLASREETVKWLMKKGRPQEIVNAAWAFATLGVEAPILFDKTEQ